MGYLLSFLIKLNNSFFKHMLHDRGTPLICYSKYLLFNACVAGWQIQTKCSYQLADFASWQMTEHVNSFGKNVYSTSWQIISWRKVDDTSVFRHQWLCLSGITSPYNHFFRQVPATLPSLFYHF